MATQLIVASPDPRFREFVREQMSHIPTMEVIAEYEEVSGNLLVRVLQDRENYPQAGVLIDISVEPALGLSSLEQLANGAPGVYAILSDQKVSSDFLLQCMRTGASDFLLQPLKRAEFSEAMARFEQHLARVNQQERQLGKMYTFVGVKGGVGTTTAAINFAAVSAKIGKSTVLVDLDLESGDIPSYLGLRHQYSIVDAVDNLDRLDQSMLEGLTVRDALGFSVLCAPEEAEKSRFVNDQHIRDISMMLMDRYEVVIIDGSRGLDPLVMSCLEQSNSIFMILTQEFPALRAAQHAMNVMVRTGFGQDAIKLVINRYMKKNSMGASMEQVQQTLGVKPFFGIPNEYEDAMRAVHDARPVVMKSGSELSGAYRSFAKKLGFEGQPAPANGKRK